MFNNLTNNIKNNYSQRGDLSVNSIGFTSKYHKKCCTNESCFSNNLDKTKTNCCVSKTIFTMPLYMADQIDRLLSFNQPHWDYNTIDPYELAAAGFYYTGIDDKVKCFICNGIIGEWNYTDNAWKEHAFWFPKCKFVLKEKGPVFVASIKKSWS